MLDNCGTPRAVREALEELPEDLEQTYNQAMERTWSKKTREDAHHLLLWLLYLFDPLTVAKVAEILTVNWINQDMNETNEMNLKIHLIIDSTLVAVDMNSRVQLAHVSVKEFLIAQYTPSYTAGLFTINELLAHEKITQICII